MTDTTQHYSDHHQDRRRHTAPAAAYYCYDHGVSHVERVWPGEEPTLDRQPSSPRARRRIRGQTSRQVGCRDRSRGKGLKCAK
jgi:hypothetical protein